MGGVRALLICPPNAGPGQRIRFKLPVALNQVPAATSEAVKIKRSLDKNGWTRAIRVSDLRFQWVRLDDKGDVDDITRFNAEKSSYVRRLDFQPDGGVRDGVVQLVPATEVFVDSRVRGNNGEILVTYTESARAQVMSFNDKSTCFQEKCLGLCVEEGHVYMDVHFKHLRGIGKTRGDDTNLGTLTSVGRSSNHQRLTCMSDGELLSTTDSFRHRYRVVRFVWNRNFEYLSRCAAGGAFDFKDCIADVELKFIPRFGSGRDNDPNDHILAMHYVVRTICSRVLDNEYYERCIYIASLVRVVITC